MMAKQFTVGRARSVCTSSIPVTRFVRSNVRPRRAFAPVRAQQQLDSRELEQRRLVRLTVAGPPDGQPPRVIEVDDPLTAPAELVTASADATQLQKAGITKSEAREQAAIIQAQREEITTLRAALAEAQDVLYKGRAAYNDVVQTKDMQIAQLYELAASGVRERAKLRQELSDMQQEMQGTKRQLHTFMSSLMQLKASMEAGSDDELAHALTMLQNSSYSQSLQGVDAALAADADVVAQLLQMQQLSDALVQDMRQDEELMQQGMQPRSKAAGSTQPPPGLSELEAGMAAAAAARQQQQGVGGPAASAAVAQGGGQQLGQPPPPRSTGPPPSSISGGAAAGAGAGQWQPPIQQPAGQPMFMGQPRSTRWGAVAGNGGGNGSNGNGVSSSTSGDVTPPPGGGY